MTPPVNTTYAWTVRTFSAVVPTVLIDANEDCLLRYGDVVTLQNEYEGTARYLAVDDSIPLANGGGRPILGMDVQSHTHEECSNLASCAWMIEPPESSSALYGHGDCIEYNGDSVVRLWNVATGLWLTGGRGTNNEGVSSRDYDREKDVESNGRVLSFTYEWKLLVEFGNGEVIEESAS